MQRSNNSIYHLKFNLISSLKYNTEIFLSRSKDKVIAELWSNPHPNNIFFLNGSIYITLQQQHALLSVCSDLEEIFWVKSQGHIRPGKKKKLFV